MSVVRLRTLPPETESDAPCMARIAAGDLGALGVLYDRYHADVRGLVQRCGLGAAEADDAVHETFLKVVDIAGRYDGRESARAWLFAVAWRVTLRRRRWAARWLRAAQRFAAERADDHAPAADAAYESSRRAQATWRMLDALPDKMRVAVVMVEIEGLSGAEAAEALGIPIATVWTRLHHGRKRLAAMSKEIGDVR